MTLAANEIYYNEFSVEEDRYIAAGRDPLGLPVYKITGERRLEKTRMLYPSCLKFMLEADLAWDSLRTMTLQQWRDRFNLILSVTERK